MESLGPPGKPRKRVNRNQNLQAGSAQYRRVSLNQRDQNQFPQDVLRPVPTETQRLRSPEALRLAGRLPGSKVGSGSTAEAGGDGTVRGGGGPGPRGCSWKPRSSRARQRARWELSTNRFPRLKTQTQKCALKHWTGSETGSESCCDLPARFWRLLHVSGPAPAPQQASAVISWEGAACFGTIRAAAGGEASAQPEPPYLLTAQPNNAALQQTQDLHTAATRAAAASEHANPP